MALLVLIILGATLGWLSSILARTERAGAILQQMGVGIVAALIAGLALNTGTILGGLSALALFGGIISVSAALVLYHAVITRRSGQTGEA
ncbi:MAG: hypothetical protein AAFR88_11840 [Pseudomonadota bacterium]